MEGADGDSQGALSRGQFVQLGTQGHAWGLRGTGGHKGVPGGTAGHRSIPGGTEGAQEHPWGTQGHPTDRRGLGAGAVLQEAVTPRREAPHPSPGPPYPGLRGRGSPSTRQGAVWEGTPGGPTDLRNTPGSPHPLPHPVTGAAQTGPGGPGLSRGRDVPSGAGVGSGAARVVPPAVPWDKRAMPGPRRDRGTAGPGPVAPAPLPMVRTVPPIPLRSPLARPAPPGPLRRIPAGPGLPPPRPYSPGPQRCPLPAAAVHRPPRAVRRSAPPPAPPPAPRHTDP